MAFTKITNTELNSRGATTLPNQPTISAAALKQEFDAPAKEIVAPHFNGLIDELEADTAGASIGLQAPSRRTGSTVKAVVDAISQDLVTVEGKLNGVTNAGLLDAISLKHEHENKALLDTYDQTNEDIEDAVNQKHSHSNKSVIDKWSESEGGAPLYNGQPMTGDMYSSEYDPDSTVKNAGGIKSYVTTGLGTKVDKVDGKGLSTNDFTDALKTKLDGIATGAEVNVQADYAQTNTEADDYIKNKPTLGTSAYKNSTSVVTNSTDLVESGAVKDIVGWGNKNLADVSKTEIGVAWNGTSNVDRARLIIPCEHNTQYILSVDGTLVDYIGIATSASIPPNGITKITDALPYTFTSGANDNYITLGFNKTNINMSDIEALKLQLEKGTTATAYEPYHASVEESKVDNSVIAPTENGTTASQDYGFKKHFTRNGKFCTVNTPISANEDLTNSSKFSSGDVADAITDLENGLISSTKPWSGNTLTFKIAQNNGVMYRLTAMNTNGLHYVDTILVNRVDGIPKHDFGEAITCSYSGENLVITLPSTDYYMYKMEQIKYGTN